MRKINVFEINGEEVAIFVDDSMMTQVSLGVPKLILDDNTENRTKYNLTEADEPKIINVLKSSQ